MSRCRIIRYIHTKISHKRENRGYKINDKKKNVILSKYTRNRLALNTHRVIIGAARDITITVFRGREQQHNSR